MKRFLLQLFVFLAILFLIAFGLDLLVSGRLKELDFKTKGEFGVWNDIYSGNVNADIFIYGSSRAWVHIDPRILSAGTGRSCYNFGMDGHHFLAQSLRHKILSTHDKAPSTIIQSLDIGTLTKTKNELYNYEQFLPFMLFNAKMKSGLDPYGIFNVFDYALPLFRYSGKKTVLADVFYNYKAKKDSGKVRTRGFASNSFGWNNDLESAKIKLGLHNVSIDSSVLQGFVNYLTDCQKKNIQLIFVYSPEYVEGQRLIGNRQQIINTYKSLSAKYKIPFYDYSEDSISFQKKYFYNSQHLNKEGSVLFTNRLVQDIKAINKSNEQHGY